MTFKKTFNKIFGVNLNKNEKEALDKEIKSQLGTYMDRHANEIDAIILWQLHEQLGFGPIRLKRFYMRFRPQLDALHNRYELPISDEPWLCTQQLKEYGIDLTEWRKEVENK